MSAMSPLESFIAGVAASVIGSGLMAYALRHAVVRYRERYPEGLPVAFATPGTKPADVVALERRLQALEGRLSDLEQEIRRGANA